MHVPQARDIRRAAPPTTSAIAPLREHPHTPTHARAAGRFVHLARPAHDDLAADLPADTGRTRREGATDCNRGKGRNVGEEQ
jgi:hypothetical protein